MLRRNDLISDDDIERLDGWIEEIGMATSMLLEGVRPEDAFNES